MICLAFFILPWSCSPSPFHIGYKYIHAWNLNLAILTTVNWFFIFFTRIQFFSCTFTALSTSLKLNIYYTPSQTIEPLDIATSFIPVYLECDLSHSPCDSHMAPHSDSGRRYLALHMQNINCYKSQFHDPRACIG